MKKLLLWICATLFAHLAHASFPATSGPGYIVWSTSHGSLPPGVYATKMAACQAWGAVNGWGVHDSSGGSNNYCYDSVLYRTALIGSGTAYTCPVNSTLSGTTCTCNGGFVQEGGTCVAPPPPPECPAAGTKNGRASLEVPLSWNGDKFYVHDEDGCVSEVNASICVAYDGKKVCEGSARYTGGYSTEPGDGLGGDAPSTADKQQSGDAPMSPTTCPTGQCPGTINGLNVCKPCDLTTTAKPKVEEMINGDGTSEKKETLDKTTCSGASCVTERTTTTTTRDAEGNVTGATSVTVNVDQSKGDYCQENPGATQCKDDRGEWGGSCQGGFVCSGDAVMCAMSREVHRRNCQFFEADQPDGDAYANAASGQDGQNTSAMKAAATADALSVGTFNTTGRSWGRSCPANPTMVLPWSGDEFEIPFNRLCGPLEVMAHLAIGITLLGSALFVVRK